MAPPVEISAAIAAVRHKLTGKDAAAAAGGVKVEDSDDEGFEATSMIVSLRCPLSGARIVTPARYKPLVHVCSLPPFPSLFPGAHLVLTPFDC